MGLWGPIGPWARALWRRPEPHENFSVIEFLSHQSFNGKINFDEIDAEIIGISKDSIKKHKNFIDKQGLKIKLASDEEGNVIESFGVWVEKKMYGRTYMGIERSTFIISGEKKILEIYKKVKVKNHANLVLERAKELI